MLYTLVIQIYKWQEQLRSDFALTCCSLKLQPMSEDGEGLPDLKPSILCSNYFLPEKCVKKEVLLSTSLSASSLPPPDTANKAKEGWCAKDRSRSMEPPLCGSHNADH